MKKVLLVIDMQRDFITGPLGNEQGQAIVEALAEEVERRKAQGYTILFTRDTHDENYLQTSEGKNLPVEHCMNNSPGWEIVPQLNKYANEDNVLNKYCFGAKDIGSWIEEIIGGVPDEIVIAGVCTDICVISNAMILKASFPETSIKVMGNLCAGVSEESHTRALEAMKPCQIEVV